MPGLFDYPTLSWLPEVQARAAGRGLLGDAAPPQSGFSRFMGQAGDWIKQNPEALAQLQGIGATMLANSGGHWGRGGGFGQALGEGLLGGMRAGQQYKYGKYLDARTQSEQAQGEIEKQKLDLLKAGKAGPDETFSAPVTVTGPDGKPMLVQPGNRGTIRPVSGYGPTPDEAKIGKPMHLGGGILYDPATGKTFEAPGVFEREKALREAGGTRVQTNVSPTSIYEHTEGKAMQEMFGSLGKTLDNQQQTAQQAADTARNIGSINQELQGVKTGTGAQLKQQALKALDAAGLTGPEQKNEIAKMESAGRLSGGLVMEQLNAMKGPATERERDYLVGITPGLATTPQGRAAMEAVAKHQADRARAKADAAASVANEVQQRGLPIGDAQKQVRDLNNQIDADFDKRFKPPALGGAPAKSLQQSPASPSVTPPSLGPIPGTGGAKAIKSKADYDALPSGAPFIWNDRPGRKP